MAFRVGASGGDVKDINALLRFGSYTVMEEKTELTLEFKLDENMTSFSTRIDLADRKNT